MGYRHSVSVAGTIYDKDRDSFLVIRRRDNGEWQLPGGILEQDETVLAGLGREVLEETGVVVEPIRLSGVYKNMSVGVVALVFLCRYVSGEPTETDESREAKWVPREAIAGMMTEAFACRLLDAVDSDLPVIRNHDGVRLLAD